MSGVVPVLMQPWDCIGIKAAALRARRDDKTIRRWFVRHGIGRRAGPRSPIEISAPALEMVLHGDMEALERLRVGDRSSPAVRRYLDFLGLAA